MSTTYQGRPYDGRFRTNPSILAPQKSHLYERASVAANSLESTSCIAAMQMVCSQTGFQDPRLAAPLVNSIAANLRRRGIAGLGVNKLETWLIRLSLSSERVEETLGTWPSCSIRRGASHA